jgi:hypothetical protein|tara:strand:+ start:10858 stop:10986 length:129 start_codon:yes stop_codon:yes gene_type:complete
MKIKITKTNLKAKTPRKYRVGMNTVLSVVVKKKQDTRIIFAG